MGTKPNIYNIATKINSDIEPAFGLEGTFTNLITYLKKRHIFFSDFDYEQLLQLLFYVHFLNKGLSKEQIEGMIDGLKVVIIVKNTGKQSYTDCQSCAGEGEFDCDSCGGSGESHCDWCSGTGEVKCDDCDGTGELGDEPCSTCQGGGNVECNSCDGTGEVDCYDCSSSGTLDCENCESGKVEYEQNLDSNIWFMLVSETLVESKNLEPYTKLSPQDMDSIMKKSYDYSDADDVPLKLYTANDLRNFPQDELVVLNILEEPSEILNLIFIKKTPTWYSPHITRINQNHRRFFSSNDEELGTYLSKMI